MPKNRFGQIVFALIVLALLGVIVRNVYHRSLNSRLIAAVTHRDVAEARLLLARGADPNSLQPTVYGVGRGTSALSLALDGSFVPSRSHDAETIACLLIEHGANLSTDHNNSFLLNACQSGRVAVARCLLEHGVDPHVTNSFHQTPVDAALSYATSLNYAIAISNATPPAERVAAQQQRRLISRELVRLLQEHGLRLNVWQAAQVDDMETLRAALDAGTPVDQREPRTDSADPRTLPTALMYAAKSGSLRAVRLLLQRGANVNCNMGQYETPLSSAISGKYPDIARLLLQRGANVNTPLLAMNMPLVSACRNLLLLVPELLQRGADLKTQGDLALSAAIQSNHPETVTLLLQRCEHEGIKPGRNTLVTAIGSRPDLVPFLLAHGADAHETSKSADSLLWYAVYGGHKELIVPLLQAGANPNARHRLFLAMSNGGFTGSPPLPDDTTPLLEAMGKQMAAFKLLLENGADPNRPNSNGLSPLIAAAQSGNVNATRLLLAHRAAVNAKDKIRHTPLHYALRHDAPKVAALLRQAGGKEE